MSTHTDTTTETTTGTDVDGTTPALVEGVDTPKAMPWPLFYTALALFGGGGLGVFVAFLFVHDRLAVVSAVAMALGLLVLLAGKAVTVWDLIFGPLHRRY